MTAFDIRPFREEDREAIVEIGNRDRPQHRQNTAAAWARRDELRKPELVDLRLCAVSPETGKVLAFLGAADLNTTNFKMKDVCDFEISVDHAHRGQGIASALYDRAAAFAAERSAARLVTGFREWTPEEPAIAFLKERGFHRAGARNAVVSGPDRLGRVAVPRLTRGHGGLRRTDLSLLRRRR